MFVDGPRPIDDLAAATGTAASGLERLLRALASVGIFADLGGEFGLTPLADYLRSDVIGSIRAWAIHIGQPYYWNTWAELDVSVRTGSSAFRARHGIDPWDYRREHPAAGAIFDAAMTGQTAGMVASIVEAYDFSGLRLVVDVGGGEGALLTAILAAYPGARGILFDQSHVLAAARPILQTAGVEDRCQLMSGSFFEHVPPGGDAYVLKNIIHDWDDEPASRILERCRSAIAGAGRLLVVERVLGPANQPDPARFSDLNMLLMLGGREREPGAYAQLFEAAGFRMDTLAPVASGYSIIEAHAI